MEDHDAVLARIEALERENTALAAENATMRTGRAVVIEVKPRAAVEPFRARRRSFDNTPARYVIVLSLYLVMKVLFLFLSS